MKYDYEKFKNSIVSALIGNNWDSYPEYTPEFIINKKGSKNVSMTIKKELEDNCQQYFFSVAFITTSGLNLLLSSLEILKEKGIKGRIITADYLKFNTPEIFEKLISLENVEVRRHVGGSFHPKGYIFEKQNDLYSVIVGSANLTEEALQSNVEWNVKLNFNKEGSLLLDIKNEFEQQWNESKPINQEWINEYRKQYKEVWNQISDKELLFNENYTSYSLTRFGPNSMQKEALKKIEESRQKGKNKALLISATGTGKTYLSAFDAKNFGAKKILFVAHRKVLLENAYNSFKNVFDDEKIRFGYITGNKEKDYDADIIFATSQTLFNQDVLNKFHETYFDYIIFDEAHHSSSYTQLQIMKKFKPKFLLGMTATPHRNNGKEIYSLYDNNIPFEVTLEKALENNLLCPFRYFGINLDFKRDFTNPKLVDFIIQKANYYSPYNNIPQGLIFVSTIQDAINLSSSLNKKGIKNIWVGNKDYTKLYLEDQYSVYEEDEQLAIKKLENLEVSYIISVDKFNEGVDIPCVNQIIMLRPTESSTIFIQQLGRGLRKYRNGYEKKTYVVVLDFIANYDVDHNYKIAMALGGKKVFDKTSLKKNIFDFNYQNLYSTIEFDEISKERIFKSIDSIKPRELKLGLYNCIQDLSDRINGLIPSHMYFYKESGKDVEEFKYSLKMSYIDALFNIGLLNESHLKPLERNVLNAIFENFIFCKTLLFINVFNNIVNKNINFIDDKYAIVEINKVFKNRFDFNLINDDGYISEQLINLLNSYNFVNWLKDLLEMGKCLYEDKYNPGTSLFKIGQTYERKDVLKILRLNSNDSATNLQSYHLYKEIPILLNFMNYIKPDNTRADLKYNDKFINKNRLSWESSTKESVHKGYIHNNILPYIENGGKMHLFVSKRKGEPAYYLGESTFDLKTIKDLQVKDKEGKPTTLINVDLVLDNSVEDSLYQYFTYKD